MTAVVQTARQNPYIGPRPFNEGETLYGRDREVRELLDLLIAERIVLLYSPSGAGKTSLIQAALIPALKREGFRVRPTVRMSLDPHPGQRHNGETNPYLLSALLLLEQERPEGTQRSIEELTRIELNDYLDGEANNQVLIFDQFEEVLTLDPTDRERKEEFFSQVGNALRKRGRWALFVMREDHVAGLDPYVRAIPTRLGSTYRLDLLGEAAARQAIQEPARRVGVDFRDAAARKLVDNLRRVRVQRPDGSMAEQLGPHIEPVQLQVVCSRLLERLPADAGLIAEADVEALGDVDTALADYYAERVGAIAAKTGVSERAIREWVEGKLITPQGIRGTVLQGPERSEGLDNRAVWDLVNTHLLRVEKQRGATWLELAHDRLIEPVRKNNAAWREAHLSPLQQRAAFWADQGRTKDLLFIGDALVDAERWANANCAELTTVECEFLDACRQARAAVQRERRQARLMQGLAIFASLVSIIAIIAFLRARAETARADRLRTAAESLTADKTALASRNEIMANDNLAMAELAREAERVAVEQQKKTEVAADNAVRAAAEAERQRHKAVASAKEAKRLQLVAEQQEAKAKRAAKIAEQNAIIADKQATIATERTRIARSARLAALAAGRAADRFDLALLLAVQGSRVSDTTAARSSLLQSLTASRRPIAFLRAHTGPVEQIAFSPDGRMVASASDDRTIVLWDASSRRTLGSLKGHAATVNSVAFSPDGKILASGSGDKTIILWDAATRSRLDTLTGHTRPVYTVAFAPDGKMLASSGADKTIVLWDVTTQKQLGALAGHTEPVDTVAFSPDGRMLASGGKDKTVILWDVGRRSKLTALTGHKDEVTSVAFSPDGKRLASASTDASVKLWDLAAGGKLVSTFTDHTKAVESLAFSPDGRILASASVDRLIMLWDMETGARIDSLASHTDGVYSVAFSRDGTLASGGADTTVVMWDISTGLRWGRSIQADAWWRLAFSPDGKRMATVGEDGRVMLWDVRSPLRGTHTGRPNIRSVAFRPPYGTMLALGGNDGTVMLWDLGGKRAPVALPGGHTRAVNDLAFSPDGKILASASDDKTVILWDVEAARRLDPVLIEHSDKVLSVAFSPKGGMLASAGADHGIFLWRVGTGKAVGSLTAHTAAVNSVAFSPNGEMLASGSDDKTIMLWDVNTRKSLGQPLFGHTSYVASVAFSPDGKMLASGGGDKSTRLWVVSTHEELGHPLISHSRPVFNVKFSPDGNMLASGGATRTVVLWNARFDAWQARACSIANRNLSYDEWWQYMRDQPYLRTCPDLPVHPTVLEAARSLAEDEDVRGAEKLFQRVKELDPGLALDPKGEATKYFHLGRGIRLARAGEVERAVESFQRANDLDQNQKLVQDPLEKARKLAARARIEEGRQLLVHGRVTDAKDRYKKAQQFDPGAALPGDWNEMCWWGSLWGHAGEVKDACENAVKGAPEKGNYRDSRGVMRALTGEHKGAIEDFKRFIAWAEEAQRTRGQRWQPLIDQRLRWISILNADGNPFTDKVLDDLKYEEPP